MYCKTVSDLWFYAVVCFAYKVHYAYSLFLPLSPTPTSRKQRMETQCSLRSVISFFFSMCSSL